MHVASDSSGTLIVDWLCWGLTSQSTIFQSCRDGAIASWVINQYFRGVKCLAQGHNTAAVGLEPRTSRSGVRHSTTEPPRSPLIVEWHRHCNMAILYFIKHCETQIIIAIFEWALRLTVAICMTVVPIRILIRTTAIILRLQLSFVMINVQLMPV